MKHTRLSLDLAGISLNDFRARSVFGEGHVVFVVPVDEDIWKRTQ